MAPDQGNPASEAPSTENPIEALERRVGVRWDAIRKARVKTAELLDKLKAALADIEDPSCAVVVTGSLGRGEASDGSDADWVLLVDGPSDPAHARMAQDIGRRINKVMAKPHGTTGTFGDIIPSHGLVHYIAGTRDTNENLTRRILLLAESRPLINRDVRERVIRNVLARYVLHDRSVPSKTGEYNRIPHFLLNDVVRYWRTMASDFASKMWERSGQGWGARNIKLRFSRKLLFIWGLLASFSGELFDSVPLRSAGKRADNENEFLRLLAEHIYQQTELAPLDLLARVVAHDDVKKETAGAIFTAYNEFLEAMSDEKTRKHLETEVLFEHATTSRTYDRLRDAANDFRFGINEVFFDQHPDLKDLIRNYGVF